MKKILGIFTISIIMLSSCAKNEVITTNDIHNNYIKAWVKTFYGDIKPSGLGIYIIKDNGGEGEKYNNENFLFVEYQKTDLEGNILETTDMRIAQEAGIYSENNYYGMNVWERSQKAMVAGVEDMLTGLRVGSQRTALIPSWLNVYKRYKTALEYYKQDKKNDNNGDNILYTIKLKGFTNDIDKWECDSLQRYCQKHLGGIDSLKYGFYYKKTMSGNYSGKMPNDTIIKVNYIGRRLDGSVFDTNIADTAKIYNIYNPERDYVPQKIQWGDKEKEIYILYNGLLTRPIEGYQKLLWESKPGDKATGVMISKWGYGSFGSSGNIPPYSPIRFDIEILK